MINMKLKILPPTLRINKRYLVLDIKSEAKLTKEDLVSAIWYGCLRLYGESETSAFNLWVMRFYNILYNDGKNYDIGTSKYTKSNNPNKYNNFNDHNNKSNNLNDSNNKYNKYNKSNTVADTEFNNNNPVNTNKRSENKENFPYYHYKAILQCQRGYENKVRGSLAMLPKHNKKRIAISTIGISGTIASSIENFIN
jgi:ribonuclease P/MRP protein subunit POP5